MSELNTDAPSEVLELYDDTIDEMANNPYGLPLFVDLYADWCMPCRKVAPIVKELAKEYKGKMIFGKLNIDENQKTAAKYRVHSIPMFLILYKGELIDSSIGAVGKDKFVKRIEQALEKIDKK